MPTGVALLRSSLSSSFSGISTGLRPRVSIYRLQPLLVRTNATVGTSAEGGVINIQQVPAPGSGYIRVLLLNRPEARNAISRELLNTLRFHVDAIGAEQGNGPTRALVIASNVDSAFCAGADLKERKGMTKEEYGFHPSDAMRVALYISVLTRPSRTEAFLKKLRGTFSRLEALPIPTISGISSMALGGGLELALCTHLRVFGSSSIVGLPETRLAIIPGAGGTYRLPRLVGASRARDLILSGRRVTGPESYFIGLCNRLVEVTPEEEAQVGGSRNKVVRESIKLALDICEGGPISIKQALQAVNDFSKGEEAENAAYDGVIETEDRFEALRAFAEKRKPVFRGK
jgi:methylglutaconyl-CoA hydratase